MAAGAHRTVTVDLDVPARMRDGAVLRANVYRPSGDGPWPVLLTRTPYGRDQPQTLTWLNPVETARQGFMVVIQDCRGRFGSDGEWTPFRDESADGYDTVEWAARLPGANGRVGMYCASYLGHTQWRAAIERPPSLAAIAPAHTWADPLDGLLARGGAQELGLGRPLDLLFSAGQLLKVSISGEERGRRLGRMLDDLDGLSDGGYDRLPVGGNPLAADPEAASWARIAGRHDRVTVPSFHVGAWYDAFLQGTLDNYVAMAALGRPAQLVVGPWTHLEPFGDPTGERRFGARASRVGVPAHPEGDLNDRQLTWFRRWLDPKAGAGGGDAADADAPPVRIFVMGANRWRDEDAWPPARARTERWSLDAGGGLRRGGEPAGGPPTEFSYDPADPVPTLGGAIVMAAAYPPGPFDQRPVEARPDVCVFTSAPLERDLEVTGPVRVVLHVESSAPSTDWVARLCDVLPDGTSYNLCDGIVRVAEPPAGGGVEIDLWSTSNVFLAGHRVRVHVTSSCFPRWDRNLNTGRQDEAPIEVARQRIHHDAPRPSWIELPVVT